PAASAVVAVVGDDHLPISAVGSANPCITHSKGYTAAWLLPFASNPVTVCGDVHGIGLPAFESPFDRRDVHVDLDFFADQHATRLERGVPVQAPLLAVDGHTALQPEAFVAERVGCESGVRHVHGHRFGDVLDRQ